MYGQRIRTLRTKMGLTAKEFGKKFNLAESTISGYENETRKVDIETLQKFADFFETNTDYLLGRTDNHEQTVVTTNEQKNIAFFGGRKEKLSDEEAAHLEESLELFRLLKAKRMAERDKHK